MITIATSIMPKRVTEQQKAIGSWLRLGFAVVSVNVPGEIVHLYEAFPGVKFVTVTRSMASEVSRPYVHLTELFDALLELADGVCGIVNSDILLKPTGDFVAFLRLHAEQALVYGARIDLDHPGALRGRENTLGFDYFFFDKNVLALFPRSNFCLGMPWWDFWFPLATVISGSPVRRLMSPVAYHIRHDLGWHDEHLEEYWAILRESCEAMLGEKNELTSKESQLRRAFAHEMARGGEILRNCLYFATDSLFIAGQGTPSTAVVLDEAVFLDMKEKLVAYDERLAECERMLAAVYATSSWRITHPLRLCKRKIHEMLD